MFVPKSHIAVHWINYVQQNMSKRARKTLIHDRLMAKDEKAYSICLLWISGANKRQTMPRSNQ